ncbi:shikimate dehydrogenase family protein [Weissella minor]|uniref:Shikimate dehydrogenase n=1 Tax=Weissella minor TaxID=1620 RepID=A0A0R2JQ95_9LACO|nr:shikimate dehydrogenase [Weissella minor]KRN76663.1 shikimate dehydrogenase [Weissella minor]
MTQQYGLIGRQIQHSLSPKLQNAMFAQEHLDANYTLFDIESNYFETNITQLLSQLSGANVTMPYKQQIMPYLDDVSDRARETASVNTLYYDQRGRLIGDTTDGAGFWWAVAQLPLTQTINQVLLIGCGGAARSIMAAKPNEINLTVASRNSENFSRNQVVVDRLLQIPLQALSAISLADYDLIIDATPVGMFDETSILTTQQIAQIPKTGIVIDLKYNKKITPLMALAQQHVPAFNGLGMLVGQGGLSHELWTGYRPELSELMKVIDEG